MPLSTVPTVFPTSSRGVAARDVGSRTFLALLCALLVALALLGTSRPAQAHDELTGSEPESGASLDAAPESVTLTFSGNVADIGHDIRVTDSQGRDLTEGEPTLERTRVVQALADNGAAGTNTVVWRVVSEDGHPIEGTFEYTVDGGGEQQSATPTATQPQAAASPQPSDAAAQDATESDDSGVPGWLLPVIGAVVVLGAGAVVLAAARRRAR